jgi:threonine/homoserine/homoserine lactone efflux protein
MKTTSSFAVVLMGAFFGLSAGISPGPLLTLVISETIKYNRKEGIKIAFAPLITDIPIILVTWFIFSRLSQFNIILSLITLSGGCFFAYLGYETIKTKVLDYNIQNLRQDSLRKGVTANLLNPHPYIFWLTIGIPTAVKAYDNSLLLAILYFFLFYFMLVGSKVLIALLVERSKSFIKNNAYPVTMKILGAALFFFSAVFICDGVKSLINNL